MKACATCQTEKPWEDFGKDKNAKANNFRKYECKACVNKKRRGAYQKENRKYHLKSKYGITPEKYREMFTAQSGACAICRQETDSKLYVDHDHVSKEVRGLLCHKCNVAIGLLYDDPQRIDRAANYIRGMPCV